MSASEIKLTESDEVIRKPVVPTPKVEPSQGEPDRSPIDEETKRDAPVEPLPDDKGDAADGVTQRLERSQDSL